MVLVPCSWWIPVERKELKVDGDDLQLEEVKEKEDVLLKLVSTMSSGSHRTARSSSSSSSYKSSTAGNKFCLKFSKEHLISLLIKKTDVE